VAYYAVLVAQNDETLSNWVNTDLVFAGQVLGKEWEVRKSLGVVGFVSNSGPSSPPSTSATPNMHYFAAWNQSSTKEFLAWRVYGSYDLNVKYYVGTTPTTDVIVANTQNSPAMIEYNGNLYVFWRDRTTSAIKYRYYTYYGYKSSIYDLYGKGITTVGDFDAVVFNNALYLVYSWSTNKWATVSKCTAATCATNNWYDFGGGVFKKSLFFNVEPGLAAEVASGVNGATPSGTTYLYIAGSNLAPDYGIRVHQIAGNETLRHFSAVPSHFPSYRTYYTIGISAVYSAFPSAGKYLLLAWRHAGDNRVFKAMVQKIDDVDDNDTWITRSDDTFLSAYYGVRLMKGNVASEDRRFAYANTSYQFKYSNLYGRY
jgi:hypothetical protein